MNLLLDTHLLLWAASSPKKLGTKARRLLADPANTLHYSAASVWEIAIKQGLGRKDFVADAAILRRALVENGYVEVPVTGEHAALVASLPPLHKDPFDRLLLAQAVAEGMQLLTVDANLAQYPGPVLEV